MHVFDDPCALFEQDRTDAGGEARWQALGFAGGVLLLLVAHTISSRRPGRNSPPHLGTPSYQEGAKSL